MKQEQRIDVKERREVPRQCANLVVFFWPAAEEAPKQRPNETADVSPGGMFVVTSKPPPRRTLVWLEAFLDTSADPPVRARARVRWRRRWRRPRGMGVELVGISPGDRQRLESWLSQVEAEAAGDGDVA